jgi:hypothetical protein
MRTHRTAWNEGRLLGQKPPLKPKEIWPLRIRLPLADKARDLALFNLAIDSKLRDCCRPGAALANQRGVSRLRALRSHRQLHPFTSTTAVVPPTLTVSFCGKADESV